MSTQIIACENCGQPIGHLETPYLWSDHVVCGACYQRLTGGVPIATASPRTAPRGTRKRIEFVDPKANARVGKTLFRVFFWIIAGIIIVSLIAQIEWATRMARP